MKFMHVANLVFLVSAFTGAPIISAAETSQLFQYKGKTYTKTDLPTSTQQMLYDAEVQHQQQLEAIFDAALLDIHFEAEAKKNKKLTRAQIEDAALTASEPSSKETKKWFDENRSKIPPNYSFEQLEGDIKNHLKQQKVIEKRQALIKKLKSSGKYQSLLADPKAPIVNIATTGYPAKGNAKAKITIVEFADYLCPHCKEATTDLNKILKTYKDKVKLVYLFFPLRAGASTELAHGAACAQKQNKFWDYHEHAFDKQGSYMGADAATKVAEAVKLDMSPFKKCLQDKSIHKFVETAKQEGERIGVSGTPSIYINGQKVQGHSYETLRAAIEKHLQQKSS